MVTAAGPHRHDAPTVRCPARCWWRSPTRTSRPASDAIATALRTRGVALRGGGQRAKFGKQIRYAERRGIPYVWFAGEAGHQVKDIRTGEQVDADPATWAPPSDDLRPKVVSRTDQEQKQ